MLTRHFKDFFAKLHPALNWILTFGFVNVTWVFFRADYVSQAVRLLNRVALCNFGPINSGISGCFRPAEILFFVSRTPVGSIYTHFIMASYIIVSLFIILGAENAYEKMQKFKPTFSRALVCVILLTWCIFSFSGVSTFLYFNF